MTIGWIDGHAGASGDMLLGALVGAGVDVATIQSGLEPLGLGVALRVEQVDRAGLAATRVHVDVPETTTLRHLADIVELLDPLPSAVRDRAVSTFRRLARAEANVHGISVGDVHFHEVGALDSIADVVGVCAGFVELGLDALHCSTLSLGSGSTSGAHGPIPIPAPAVLAVLGGIAPVTAGPSTGEATTPTGAALLAEWVDAWTPMPAMTVRSTGSGAGARDLDTVSNACRLVVGDASPTATRSGDGETMVQLDANVDDLDPRVWPEAIAAVLSVGAVDAWVTPIVMKKGRPAHTFSALCSAARAEAVTAEVFRQTSTIGVRRHEVFRSVLVRSEDSIEVDGRTIRVKIATIDGDVVNRSAEWDDVVAAAAALGRSAHDVLAAAHRLL